jgi:hypothetical protein
VAAVAYALAYPLEAGVPSRRRKGTTQREGAGATDGSREDRRQ